MRDFVQMRFRYGKVEYGMPSRFLKDIDSGYLGLELHQFEGRYHLWPLLSASTLRCIEEISDDCELLRWMQSYGT
mgnify:CR=1 FL=1